METIRVQCPDCQRVLDVDAGFAGGVCRCSACGAMMSVPARSQASQPQRPDRPDRPDSPDRDDASTHDDDASESNG